MKALKRHGAAAFNAIKGPRFTPDYNDDVSNDYREKLRQDVDAGKPKDFKLTPICEPGW